MIRAVQLRVGDMFETLLSKAAGIRRSEKSGENGGVPVELWYEDGKDAMKMLAPGVKVRLLERAQGVA